MTRSFKSTALALALLGGTVLGGAAVLAQAQRGALYDPAQFPETKGVVKQYTLSPRGDVDGLLLNDGTEVKLPPHLSTQTVFAVRPGDAVTIRGLKARALPLIDAASVTNDATGAVVIDQGGPAEREGVSETITGKVVAALHGKRGEINGAVLETGAQLRLPPREAERFADLLQPGAMIAVRGDTTKTALGTVIEATALGVTPDRLAELYQRKPRPPRGGPDRDDRGPPPPRGPRG